ncbi:MAG: DNA repair protein RecO [Rhodospirillales bacterium]|nr:DNA repair protein RecO [Rhodospirillales bacterium]MCW8862456.1 DNA repair protein RecO [Rhodospirillales bacterium]MCW8952519.1 DNA repair protein RecO [Rhodospirillales bacterium]MCW8970029.1 DNA repair protein RecO [Rhodospirillales bacterium]MCW9003003.1 DNA repair protein RecO [Rhodospirillales bacterium]
MEWTDQGIVLSARKHGESSLILSLLTREHGRHSGLVRGGSGRKARGLYQVGNLLSVDWRARLPEHLGTFTCEIIHSYSAEVLDNPLSLSGLMALACVADSALPEREVHKGVFDAFVVLLKNLCEPDWPAFYVKWEIGLLSELGYGLDLSVCAATGSNDELAFVSPKSGRAVSLSAGEPYQNKLLTLPRFLSGDDSGRSVQGILADEVVAGLAMSGYFLERHVFAPHNRNLPPARGRFVDRIREMATISGI